MTPGPTPAPVAGDLWRRHPADVARLLVSVGILGLLVTLAWIAPGSVRELSADLVDAVRRLPRVVTEALLGLAQLAAVTGPVVGAVWLVTRRRLRLAGTALLAASVAAASMASLQGWLDRTVPTLALDAQGAPSWLTGAAFPSGAYVAGLTAAVVVLGAGSTRSWRRAGWGLVALAAAIRVATAVAVPVSIGVTVALGAAVASVVLVALGAPVRRLGVEAVLAAVRSLGVDTDALVEVDLGARHSRTFRGAGPTPVFVKLVGRDERAAEALVRGLRALRVRGLDDERVGWSPNRIARHEALAGLLAQRSGARVADVLAVGSTPDGDGITVLELLEGRRLVDLDPEDITDDLLRDIWRQVAALGRARIAHRWCDATHVLVDPAGRAHLIDLRWAVVGADDRLLGTDVADMVTSVSLLVGVERAVASAAAELPAEMLAAAAPLIQPLVLSRTTRAAVKAAEAPLGDVRDAVAAAAGIDEVELAPLARVTAGRIVGWVGTAVLVYVALAFAVRWDSIAAALGDADWSYLPALVLLTLAGYVGGAISLIGAVPRPLPFVQSVEVMFAQSFLNRFTPANAGGMALRTRYLQSHGADLTMAAASVGLTSVASGMLQVVLLVVLALWAGASDGLAVDLPSMDTVAVVILVVVVVISVVAATAWGRRVLSERVLPTAARLGRELGALGRDPAKLSLLFGGALIAKLTTIVAFVLSARAFGVDESFARLALLYMTANTVASAAPTPGGVGAIEAALVAVLTGIGLEPAEALSIVLVFRLITYWLPVPPAWLALRRVRRLGVV